MTEIFEFEHIKLHEERANIIVYIYLENKFLTAKKSLTIFSNYMSNVISKL